jgi:hypothetical protein
MGYWPIGKYADYVRTHAEGADKFSLLGPYEEPLGGENPSIFLAYHSMPRWMDRFDVDFDDSSVNFRRNLHKYRVDCTNYTGEVRAQFEPIKSSLVGKALLAELRRTIYRIRIIPYWDFLDPNADETPWDGVNETAGSLASVIASTRRGVPRWRGGTTGPEAGTGAETSSEIRYTPSMYHASDGPGEAPDEFLFHELVHASRDMRGVAYNGPVNRNYDNLDEYIAIILQNIYLSEKGQVVFRGSHRRGRVHLLRGADADRFLLNPQHVSMSPARVIQNFKDTQPEFYRDVVNLPPGRPKYNWVKEFDHTPGIGR